MAQIYAIPVDVDFTDDRRDERAAWLTRELGPGHSVTVEAPRHGAAFLESTVDQLLTARGLLELGLAAQQQGFDAIAVLCMTDPSVDALREALQIPVVGSAQASCLTAAMVAGRFSIVTILQGAIPPIERAVAASGIDPRCVASIRSIDMAIAEMVADPQEVLRRLEERGRKAVQEDGARAVILGCTEMGTDAAALLSERLGVPVIDPNVTAVQFARAMAEMKYGHSRMAYPRSLWKIEERMTTALAVGRK